MSKDKVTPIGGLDFDEIQKAAEKELRDERVKNAKVKFKAKIQSVERARAVLRNEERELEDLKHELSQGIGS